MINDDAALFCTIVTESHIPYAKVLFSSISRHYPNANFAVLICGCDNNICTESDIFPSNVQVLTENTFSKNPTAVQIIKKYSNTPDYLRWSLKPSLLLYLLQKKWQKAIYFDSDIYVVGDLQALVMSLQEYRCLITPHWRTIDPQADQMQFELCFQHGVYNAGFFGISSEGIDIIRWWESVCLHNCSTTVRKGYYVDQRYLDILPVYFKGVQIVQNRGCNIAFWNLLTNERSIEQGKLKIASEWDAVFIHFSPLTIEYILSGRDPQLDQYYSQWSTELINAGLSTGETDKNIFKTILERGRKKIARTLYDIGDNLNY